MCYEEIRAHTLNQNFKKKEYMSKHRPNACVTVTRRLDSPSKLKVIQTSSGTALMEASIAKKLYTKTNSEGG